MFKMHILDVLSVLCTLGDFVGRIEHSAAADQKQLMKIKEREEKEFNRISKLRHSRDSKLSFLKGEDEDKFVFAVHERLGEDLQATNKELTAAIYEEEEARKVSMKFLYEIFVVLRVQLFYNLITSHGVGV